MKKIDNREVIYRSIFRCPQCQQIEETTTNPFTKICAKCGIQMTCTYFEQFTKKV